MLNVVLYQPEIPANTGNVGRTCVLTGARLHLVGPLGFSLDDRAVQRAGLAYWESLDLRRYDDWDAFLERNPSARAAFAGRDARAGEGAAADASEAPETSRRQGAGPRRAPAAGASSSGTEAPRMHLLTKSGSRTYAQTRYRDGDWLVFGRESTGLPLGMLRDHPGLCERIPMLADEQALDDAEARQWRASHERLHPELRRDACGNFVDARATRITSLNLSNAVAIVLYEALRQLGFPGMSAGA
jgi:tRNA (cytidine/uridine-2'-O-)-methyltransferase